MKAREAKQITIWFNEEGLVTEAILTLMDGRIIHGWPEVTRIVSGDDQIEWSEQPIKFWSQVAGADRIEAVVHVGFEDDGDDDDPCPTCGRK